MPILLFVQLLSPALAEDSIHLSTPATGQVRSGAIVNGQPRPVVYDYRQEKRHLLTPEEFQMRTGVIERILSPNRILVHTDSGPAEFQLIGLMDFSLGIHRGLRKKVIRRMQTRLRGRRARLFLPLEPRQHGLLQEHAFLNVDRRMVNLDLLSEGYGILPEGQRFFPHIHSIMDLSMQEAARRKLGIWGGPTTEVSSDKLQQAGIRVGDANAN